MKGKIDGCGSLLIKRGDQYKEQLCKHNLNDPKREEMIKCCGDLCPLFGEPKETTLPYKIVCELKICQDRTLCFDEFEDKRPQE